MSNPSAHTCGFRWLQHVVQGQDHRLSAHAYVHESGSTVCGIAASLLMCLPALFLLDCREDDLSSCRCLPKTVLSGYLQRQSSASELGQQALCCDQLHHSLATQLTAAGHNRPALLLLQLWVTQRRPQSAQQLRSLHCHAHRALVMRAGSLEPRLCFRRTWSCLLPPPQSQLLLVAGCVQVGRWTLVQQQHGIVMWPAVDLRIYSNGMRRWATGSQQQLMCRVHVSRGLISLHAAYGNVE